MAQTATQPLLNGEAIHKNPLYTDFCMIETLSQLNRERIQERVVHAKGVGAFGEFEVTDDISDVCNIDMFLGIGKKTPCMARFSTTALETGSNDLFRDIKGMAMKFFTEQGNFDAVCLSLPFFFLRDPSNFPSSVHATKRDPKTGLLNPSMWWDWVCNNPESLPLTLSQWGKMGIMFTWKGMQEYTCHAFKWVMPDGSWKYVHLSFDSDQPPYKARAIDFNDPDCCTQDLYDPIDREEYPSWAAQIQVVNPKDALDLSYYILDVTKNWPEEGFNYTPGLNTVPWRRIGRLTLNRKPTDNFGDIEQAAFSPSHLVPGIEPSEDPMLQARLFAYPDAQRYRLGPHNQKLPTNQAKHEATPGPRVLANTEADPKRIAWLAEPSSKSWSVAHELDYNYADDIVNNISESVAETDQKLRERVYATHGRVAIEKIVEEKKIPKEIKKWQFSCLEFE